MANSHMTFGTDLLPKTTNTYNLGNSNQKWNIYANTINGVTPEMGDTKNTAGATNSTSKLFLIGATAQTDNPQTYSNTYVFATNGLLSTASLGINDNSTTNKIRLVWNSTEKCLDFVF